MATKFSDLRLNLTVPQDGFLIGYDPNYTGPGSKNFRIGADKLGGTSAAGGVTTEQFLDLVELMTTTSIVQGGTFFSDTFATNAGINAVSSTRAVHDATNKKVTPTTKDSSLLLHFDDVQGATTITDTNAHPMTLAQNGGIARIDTAQSKFGGSSLLIAGGARLTTPASEDFGVAAGDFTFETFAYNLGPASGSGTLFEVRTPADTTKGFSVLALNGSLAFYDRFTGAINSGTSTISGTTSWKHLAVVRKSGVLKIYVDGVAEYTGANTTNFGTIGAVYIGSNATSAENLAAYLDEMRFTKSAKYDANFAPPTSQIVLPPPNSAYMLVSNAWHATAIPSTIGLRIQARTLIGIVEPAYILNTDMTAAVSRDGGMTWTPVTLMAHYTRTDGYDVLTGSADVSSQPSGSNIAYKLTFRDGRSVEIGAVVEYLS